MFTADSLKIGDLDSSRMALIAEHILTISVDYSMDMANQLTVVISDPGLEWAANNYFQVGRDIIYEATSITRIDTAYGQDGSLIPAWSRTAQLYEISSCSVQQNGGISPQWTIEAMPKAIQQMKRDKKPGAIGASGFEFVRKAASKYGLKFVGEKSSRVKGSAKNSGDGQQDSVWDVIQNIARQSQYVVFVADGTMYFASQNWLMYKWGTERIPGVIKKDKKGKVIKNKKGIPEKTPDKYFIPMEYQPTNQSNTRRFETLSLPQIRKSDNDPMEGTGSLLVARDNGTRLRPGMTIRIANIPTMNKYYLITRVSFAEQVTDPVSVEFRTPERLNTLSGKPPKIPQLPIGKTYKSDGFFTSTPKLGITALGAPNFSETAPPPFELSAQLASTSNRTIASLPNSRRTTQLYPSQLPILIQNLDRKKFLVLDDYPASDWPEKGNIDLYNRPIKPTKEVTEYRCSTMYLHLYEKEISGTPHFIITERLWPSEIDGTPEILSIEDAEAKYDNYFVHHGVFVNKELALVVMSALIYAQKLIVQKRFPKSWKILWSGLDKHGRSVSIPTKWEA